MFNTELVEVVPSMVLSGDQLARLYRVWATDIEGCPRSQQHRILGSAKSPPHFVLMRGTALHSIHENIIKGVDHPLDIHIPEFQNEIMDSLSEEIVRLNQWREKTTIDLSKAEAEVKYELDLGRGYLMVRKIDILTPECIIDIKSGSFNGRVSKSVLYELAMSHEAVEKAGEGRRDCYVIYLGGSEPKEIKVFKDLNELLDSTLDAFRKIEEVIEMREKLKLGEKMRVEPSNLCAYCDYRGGCRGI